MQHVESMIGDAEALDTYRVLGVVLSLDQVSLSSGIIGKISQVGGGLADSMVDLRSELIELIGQCPVTRRMHVLAGIPVDELKGRGIVQVECWLGGIELQSVVPDLDGGIESLQQATLQMNAGRYELSDNEHPTIQASLYACGCGNVNLQSACYCYSWSAK